MDRYDIIDKEGALTRFNELLTLVNADEINQWRHHPCTKALVWSLVYSEMEYHDQWRLGNLTAESTDGTAQLNAKALGALEAIDKMKMYILEEISNNDSSDRP